MRTLLAGAVSAVALLASASAEDAATFDLWTSSDAAQTLVAVAATGENAPLAAAAGAQPAALDILAADAAATAVADLKTKTDETALAELAGADGEKAIVKKTKKSKKTAATEPDAEHQLVLVKEIADGGEQKVEKKIIKLKSEAEVDASASPAAGGCAAAGHAHHAMAEAELAGMEIPEHAQLAKYAGDSGKIFVLEKTENGAPVRLVHIAGADAEHARLFIDETQGLDDAEKAAMKTALGL